MSDSNAQQQGGDGGQPWFAGFQNAEAKTFVESKGFKDPESLVTSYANMEKLLGADRAGRTVVLPKDANDAEGLKAFRAKMLAAHERLLASGTLKPKDVKAVTEYRDAIKASQVKFGEV